MANLKNITDLPVVESAEGLNLIVNDNGAAKQISASAIRGTSNWDELENKPFFDTREYGDIKLTFDGDITGKEIIEVEPGVYLVKISDKIPTYEEIIGSVISIIQNGENMTLEVSEEYMLDLFGALSVGEFLFVSESDKIVNGLQFSKGVWFAWMGENNTPTAYVSEFSWYGTVEGELKPVEEKYIPDTIARQKIYGHDVIPYIDICKYFDKFGITLDPNDSSTNTYEISADDWRDICNLVKKSEEFLVGLTYYGMKVVTYSNGNSENVIAVESFNIDPFNKRVNINSFYNVLNYDDSTNTLTVSTTYYSDAIQGN